MPGEEKYLKMPRAAHVEGISSSSPASVTLSLVVHRAVLSFSGFNNLSSVLHTIYRPTDQSLQTYHQTPTFEQHYYHSSNSQDAGNNPPHHAAPPPPPRHRIFLPHPHRAPRSPLNNKQHLPRAAIATRSLRRRPPTASRPVHQLQPRPHRLLLPVQHLHAKTLLFRHLPQLPRARPSQQATGLLLRGGRGSVPGELSDGAGGYGRGL